MPLLYDAPGRHRWITVYESATGRFLLLDGSEEGAMDLSSEDPIFDYLWFHKGSILAGEGVRMALVLGAGAFTIPKALALDYPHAVVETTDVEPELHHIGRTFFRLDSPEYAGIRFHGLPAEVVLGRPAPPYDFIFDDLFDGFQHVPETCRGADHFDRLRRALTRQGSCIKNMIWDVNRGETRTACARDMNDWGQIFPNHLFLALGDSPRGHNLLLFGSTGSQTLCWDELRGQLARAGVPEEVLQRTRPAGATES